MAAGNTAETGRGCLAGAGGAGEAGSCELNEVTGSDSEKSSEIVAVQRGRDRTAGSRGELEICEEGASVAGGRRKREEASEGGEAVGGDAGVCIAACKFLASRCSVAHTSVDRQMFWSPSSNSASIFLEGCVSEFGRARELVCVSACRRGRCVSVYPRRGTPVMFDTLTACRSERFASARVNLCPSVDLTESGEAVVKKKKKRRQWKEGVRRDWSLAEIRLGKTYWLKMWTKWEREERRTTNVEHQKRSAKVNG